MQKILVPTDFSDCAGRALRAAGQLAQVWNASLHVLHASDSATATWLQKQEGNDNVQDKIHAVAQSIQAIYPDMKVHMHVQDGNLTDTVKEYVASHMIDIVVIGSHGISGKSEFFIGSNTQKVVRSLHVPVLVIKNELQSTDFKKVVFASSFNKNEEDGFSSFY